MPQVTLPAPMLEAIRSPEKRFRNAPPLRKIRDRWRVWTIGRMKDEDFGPRLGRMRAAGSPRGRKCLHRVMAAIAQAGGARRPRGPAFSDARIGRGSALGRLLLSERSWL